MSIGRDVIPCRGAGSWKRRASAHPPRGPMPRARHSCRPGRAGCGPATARRDTPRARRSRRTAGRRGPAPPGADPHGARKAGFTGSWRHDPRQAPACCDGIQSKGPRGAVPCTPQVASSCDNVSTLGTPRGHTAGKPGALNSRTALKTGILCFFPIWHAACLSPPVRTADTAASGRPRGQHARPAQRSLTCQLGPSPGARACAPLPPSCPPSSLPPWCAPRPGSVVPLACLFEVSRAAQVCVLLSLPPPSCLLPPSSLSTHPRPADLFSCPDC